MADIILIAVILVAFCCAIIYIYKAKKSGKTCMGCPNSKNCNKKSCGTTFTK